jgi:hypothetical protein
MLFDRLLNLTPDMTGLVAPATLEQYAWLSIENGRVVGAQFGKAMGYEALVEWLGSHFDGLRFSRSAPVRYNIHWSDYNLFEVQTKAFGRARERTEVLANIRYQTCHTISVVQHGLPVISLPGLNAHQFWQHIQIAYYLESWMSEEVFLVAGAPQSAIIEGDTHYVCRSLPWGWIIATTHDSESAKRILQKELL